MNPQNNEPEPQQSQVSTSGQSNQSPIVPSGAYGQPVIPATQPPKKSKKMIIVGISLLIIGIAAVIFFVSKDSDSATKLEEKSGSIVQQVQDTDGINVTDQKNKVALIQSLIAEMAANNRGVLPTSTTEFDAYINSTRQADTLRDTIVQFETSFNETRVPVIATIVQVYPGNICDGNKPVPGTNRQVALVYALSTTKYACEAY